MSSNSSSKQQELKHIASIVRALVTSRKPPCYMRDVLRDYPEVECVPLPYRSLGYKTAQELLEDTGEFIFSGNRCSGDTVITAKYSNKTAHIEALVRGQKSKRTIRAAPLKALNRPQTTSMNRSYGFGDRNNNSNYYSSHQQNHFQRPKPMGSTSGNQQRDLREMHTIRKKFQPVEQVKPPQSDKKPTIQNTNQNQYKQVAPRAILGASNSVATKTKSGPQLTKPQIAQILLSNQASKQQRATEQNIQNRLHVHQPAAVKAPQAVESSVVAQQQISVTSLSTLASRLQLKQQQKQQEHLQQQRQQEVLPQQQHQHLHQQQQQHKIISPQALTKKDQTTSVGRTVYFKQENSNTPTAVNQHSSKAGDAIHNLIEYCQSKNYSPPLFTCFKNKFAHGKYSCRVHINDVIYSTYPEEYVSEYMARVECAKRALTNLTNQEKKRPLPSCSFTDSELLEKLYKELLNHPHGIFAKNLPDLFEKTFQLSPPENWFGLIQTSSLFTAEVSMNKLIIFANENADSVVDEAPAVVSGDKAKVLQIDPISLPWTTEYWDVLITHCSSTIEIWGRLFGNEYNVRFDALITDIDAYMATKKERPFSISPKSIYLVFIDESWHRVRVEELDKKESALCFFIDFGDADWLKVDQLYICETNFLKLPAQAVPFSLYGLEDFEENPFARRCLDDLLPNKPVVGKIFTRESEFYDTNSKFHAKIQVVFFDTSNQEDINLNDQLSNTICKKTFPPELKKTTVTNVIVTNVNALGEIFLQVKSPELKYVQNLTMQIVDTKLQKDQQKIGHDDFTRSNMFLVCDDSDEKNIRWYRATKDDLNPEAKSEKYQMYFIDHGLTKTVELAKIYLLDSLSMALSKFPAQAVKVRLHNIPAITRNIVGRMRGLLPNDCVALTKLVEPGPIPFVTIYTRLEGPDSLCTINDVIRIEHELEGCSDFPSEKSDSGLPTNLTLDFSKAATPNKANTSKLASPTTPTSNSFIDVTRGLILTTVPGSPQKVNELPKLKNYDELPNFDDFFEVRVTMSANPCNFTIQPLKHYSNLMTLMKELQEFCATNDEFIPSDMVQIGEAFAAKNPDGYFHRVTVVKKIGDMIHVSFCDFGDIAIVESSQLKTLPLELRHLPKMALQAKLHGIKAVNGEWTLDDCLFFRKLTVGQNLVSVIKDITYDLESTPPTQILELQLIDVTTEEDIFIHEMLINEKRAIEEN